MEALLVAEIPEGSQWQYEPKWDGFRCIIVSDGDDIELHSKSGRPLNRYFPEVVEAVSKLKAQRFVLDCEIVVAIDDELSFDALQLRLHPAESRVRKLSKETPATVIVFDLLGDESGKNLLELPLGERRNRLELFAEKYFHRCEICLSPATTDVACAKNWFKQVGASLDGIIAKRLDMTYQAGNRHGMQKIKNMRSADCVVGGFRYGSKPEPDGKYFVGSLLLGLYDDAGLLHHVGFTSSIKKTERAALTKKFEKLKQPPGFTGNRPGGPSRWSTERSGQWEPLKPELVVEVIYDHFTGDRFRHGTSLQRWRPDKAPRQCTIDQVCHHGAGALKLLK
jgi:ATP-dependent DNA ligase